MQIIPALDIQQGQVVHAIGGQRNQYWPIQSQICADSEPCSMVRAFLDIHPFTTVYIADLDAIQCGNPDKHCIQSLIEHFAGLNFWLDQGLCNKTAIIKEIHKRIIHVVGSETGLSPVQLSTLVEISPQPILSLDFRNGMFLGDNSLLQHPETWPDKVILMNLDRVGTASGGDKYLIDKITRSALHSHVYIAGGIGNISDILALQDLGIEGILVATALHTGRLAFAEINAITS